LAICALHDKLIHICKLKIIRNDDEKRTMGGTKNYPREYLIASALAATINYPLWRASAIGQSGFVVESSRIPALLSPYVHAFAPPYKGALATVLGMTWARAAIFWGSDYGKEQLMQMGIAESVATVLPPLVVSTIVQCVNMPLVRATITIQDPQSKLPNVAAALRYIHETHGWAGLWHGTSAGVLKTVPKYCTAVVVKGFMEDWLPPPTDPSERLWRSAYKSAAAGIAGAALTNPLDVIRNEMFKTNLEMTPTVQKLWRELGVRFLARGLGKNMIAVAIPVACTIFFTDALVHRTQQQQQRLI
jgi:hypothetical protein